MIVAVGDCDSRNSVAAVRFVLRGSGARFFILIFFSSSARGCMCACNTEELCKR